MRREQHSCLLPQVDSQTLMATLDTYTDLAVALLTHYSFDLGGYDAQEIVTRWQAHYPVNWLHLAVIEALYQGRYKAVSVQQILTMWHRREQATYHFNMEFERLICSKFPVSLTAPQPLALPGNASQPNQLHPSPIHSQPNHPNQLGQTTQKLSTNTPFHLIENSDRHPKENPPKENYQQQNSQNPLPRLASGDTQLNHHEPEKRSSSQTTDSQTANYSLTPSLQFHPPIPHFQPEMDIKQIKDIKQVAKNQSLDAEVTDQAQNSLSTHVTANLTANFSESVDEALPSIANHPPIGQFTPQADQNSANFTSKLYAMVAKG